MIQLILYRALPGEFYIGQVKIEKIEKWYGVGFKALITNDTIKKLKDNSDITNGTLGLLNAGGGIAAATATGAAMSTPIGPIVVLFTSLIKIYLGLIKKRDKGSGVYFTFFLGLVPPPLVHSA